MSETSSAPCSRVILAAFIAAAKPGNRLTYFIANNTVGYRGLDWMLKDRPSADLCGVVNQVRSLYNAGLVNLVQDRRIEPFRTHYIAEWRERPAPVDQHNQLLMAER